MALIFLAFFVIVLVNTKIYKKDFNNNYLDRKNTSIINGMFIIIVFFHHFSDYVVLSNNLDIYFYKVIALIGQLMVTSFLFFSGYGIYESIKNKARYVDNLFVKRFIPIYIDWFIALLLFVITNILVGNNLSISKVLLSLTGWVSIGNSNWYMFATFVFYLLIIICFKICKSNRTGLYLFTIMVIIFIVAMSFLKPSWWYNTLLCFPLGMWYSYEKKNIDSILFKSNKQYLLIVTSLFTGFALLYASKKFISNGIYFNLIACSFILLVVSVCAKIECKSKIFTFFGKNLFWMYILQRIPMIILKGKITNIYIYFGACFIITVLMVILINKMKTSIKFNKKC